MLSIRYNNYGELGIRGTPLRGLRAPQSFLSACVHEGYRTGSQFSYDDQGRRRPRKPPRKHPTRKFGLPGHHSEGHSIVEHAGQAVGHSQVRRVLGGSSRCALTLRSLVSPMGRPWGGTGSLLTCVQDGVILGLRASPYSRSVYAAP